jgi:two-component system cell cycle response regulator
VLLGARLRYLLRQKRLFDEFRRRQHTGSTLGLAPPIPIEAVPLPRRLLVLTDSGDLDQPLRWALTDSGFAVSTEVARPLAAVSPPGRGPELVLIDVSERNSLSIAARYRRIDPGLPIALAHEVRDPFRAVRALDLGIAEPLPRPLDAGATAAALTRMAERHALGERLRRQYRRSLELAMIDSLTGVFNRRYLDSYFKCNGAQAPRGPFALLMIDVDHFKDINDRFGHSGGDSALCQIARRLADNVRASDMVVRAGGEEFVVLMPRADNAAARTVAERLRMVVAEKPLVVQGNEIVATVSIGIAEGALAPTPAALLADADAALYAAKRSGRNCITAAGESADASHSPAA